MFGSSQAFATQAAPSPDAKRFKEDKQICLPVTIRAMEMAVAQQGDSGEELKFYGAEASTLIVVAAVESVVRQSTGLEMVLNDATGRVKARYFVSDGAPPEDVVPGVYVSAFGSVRTAPVLHLSLNGLRLVDSADEVSYHFIEAAHAMLRLQQPDLLTMPTPEKTVVAGDVAMDMKTPEKPKALQTTEPSPAAFASPAPVATPVETVKTPAAAPQGADLKAKLMGLLRSQADEAEGLAVGDLCGKLAAAEAEVRACIKTLVDEGEIFATIDEDHYGVL